MFAFRGRNLCISEELLAEYERYEGVPFSEEEVYTYVHNIFIRGKPEPLSLISSLTDEDLKEIIEGSINAQLTMYRY